MGDQTQFQIDCENLAARLRADYHGLNRTISANERAHKVAEDLGAALYVRAARQCFFDPGCNEIYDYLIELARRGGQAWGQFGDLQFRFIKCRFSSKVLFV